MRCTRNKLTEQFGPYYPEEIISDEQLYSEAFWQQVIAIQKAVSEVFSKDLCPLIRGEKKRMNLPWKRECYYYLTRTDNALEIKLAFFQSEKDYLEHFPLENPKAAAIDSLYELMDGVPLNAIRECRECKKTFVQIKGKRREFCEDRCMNRWHSRERRKVERKTNVQTTKKRRK